jgi:hypothetical protein
MLPCNHRFGIPVWIESGAIYHTEYPEDGIVGYEKNPYNILEGGLQCANGYDPEWRFRIITHEYACLVAPASAVATVRAGVPLERRILNGHINQE